MELVGRQVGRVGDDEGERDLDRRIREAPVDLAKDHPDHDPHGHPADGSHDEVRDRGAGFETLGQDRHDSRAVGDQRDGVVQQALALEDRDDPARDVEAPEDRGRGDGVGRRHDGSEGERAGPAQAGDQRVGDHADRADREQHEADGQERDGPGIGPEVAKRGHVGGNEEQRGQQDDQDQLRFEHDGRQAGEQRQAESADHEQDRVGDLDPVGELDDDQDRDEQREDENDFVHADRLSGEPAARPMPRDVGGAVGGGPPGVAGYQPG